MTYRELLAELCRLKRFDPTKLDDHIAVVTINCTPVFITHVEFNDGSIVDGAEPYQLLLMTV